MTSPFMTCGCDIRHNRAASTPLLFPGLYSVFRLTSLLRNQAGEIVATRKRCKEHGELSNLAFSTLESV